MNWGSVHHRLLLLLCRNYLGTVSHGLFVNWERYPYPASQCSLVLKLIYQFFYRPFMCHPDVCNSRASFGYSLKQTSLLLQRYCGTIWRWQTWSPGQSLSLVQFQPVSQRISFVCSESSVILSVMCVCCGLLKQLTRVTPEELHAIIGKSLCTVNQCMAFKCFEIPLGKKKLT